MDYYSDQYNNYFQNRNQNTLPNQRRSNQRPPDTMQQQTVVPMPVTTTQPTTEPVQTQNQSTAPISPNQTPIYRQQIVSGENPQYFNQFLSTQIGRRIKADFLIGTNMLLDKTGVLLEVGANYILINETATDDYVVCDYYSLKFVTIYY